MSLAITSAAFSAGGSIPAKYTCQGRDISPPLSWAAVPEQAKSLVVIVDDPDAPDPLAPKMTWAHWLLYNLPPHVTGLAEGVSELPGGTLEGTNDWRRSGYGGPCPPVGRHRYFFRLFALDTVLPDLGRPTEKALLRAMAGHVLAQAELVGTYQKH